MFPSFCDPKQPVDNCKRQIAAFLAITKEKTTGLTKVNDGCVYTSTNNNQDCYNYPPIESTASHWLTPLIYMVREKTKFFDNSLNQSDQKNQMYYGRGAGMIKGAEEFYRFAQDIG